MNICFSFDSDDFLTPEAADAEKWWTEELTSRGIKPTIHCVAENATRMRPGWQPLKLMR